MPPARHQQKKAKKEMWKETYATKNLSTLFYFGPQPKKTGDNGGDFGDFLRIPEDDDVDAACSIDFPKPFYTPYDEFKVPKAIQEDTEYKKKCEKEAIIISDADTEDPVEDSPDSTKLTIYESRILQISNLIRNKPNWQQKIHDSKIVEKWISELKEQASQQKNKSKKSKKSDMEVPELSKCEMQFAMDQLKFLASLCEGNLEVSSVTGVWQSDSLIPDDLLQELKKGVAILEDVPEDKKDWHPDSGSKVLDLVHPSLFCWVNGVTPLYNSEEETCKRYYVNIKLHRDFTRSMKFQWLPSEFDVNEKGEVQILSYINNLDPNVHKPMYDTIAKIFEKFVPLFEKVLADLVTPKDQYLWGRQMEAWKSYYHQEHERQRWLDDNPEFDDEEEEEEEEEEEGPKKKKKKVEKKKPKKGKKYGPPPVPKEPKEPSVKFQEYKLQKCKLTGRKLQVIVKLANIELTPESPSYPGGSWHVEGMRNEDIVSSGIYYYESENITESILNFRMAAQLDFGSYDEEGSISSSVYKVYGVRNGTKLNDDLGGLITKQGRCIAFPNLYQHQVAPFELVDKKKKGVRKILVFFLIDPNHRVLSTAKVPPQHKAWAMRELAPIFHTLPKFILQKIISYLPLMDMKTAKDYRTQLMAERKTFVQTSTEFTFERSFNLCEH